MGIAVNLTPCAVAEAVGRDPNGEILYVVVVKATYSFADAGPLAMVAPLSIVDLDEYAGPPATSGLRVAGEVGLPKPQVDILLAGDIKFRSPVEEAFARLQVGRRLDKRVKLFGDRFWLPGVVSDLTPSHPRATSQIPIDWARSSGGADANDHQLVDRRNPVGCTTGRASRDFHSKRLPNFEDPMDLVKSWKDRPTPVGFGPIAPHWEPRAGLAGTYDDVWRDQRAPLLPKDFKPAFLNSAPVDQRLSGYHPGEEVRLTGLTPGGTASFVLPDLSVPVMFVTRELIDQAVARIDTIVIEPAAERISLIARAVCSLRPSATAMRQIFVGSLTPGRRRALELGKAYLDLRRIPVRGKE